ncbi:hypothetical protein BE08_45380 [Sorangium cellulosum]|uniref:Uncharacterized protein n=1 Tax=Sorangium cellulosum TaxID=56 RepID=A0A150NZW5_SORCE|nr:hypothetical protein BE08_45380 [Sorangium cellulosum]
MADGNQGGGGPAQAPAGDFLTKLSEAYPYGDEPPRLTVAINDMAAGAPDGTEFGDDGVRPVRHEVPEDAIYRPETIGDVLAWIDQRIRVFPMDQVWLTQAGPLMNWCADPKEEQWAQAVTEILFGATYGGPGSCYDMGRRKKASPFPASENWESYIFGRIQRRYRSKLARPTKNQKHIYGCYNVASWLHPDPIPDDLDNALPPGDASNSPSDGSAPHEDMPPVVGPMKDGKLLTDPAGPRWKEQENTDPAVPIVVACQHLATYGALTRGFRVEHLDSIGYAAQFGTGGFAIFSGKPAAPGDEAPPQGGRWYTLQSGAGDEDKASTGQAGGASPPPVTHEDLLKVERARQLSPPLAPGTIFVFDPDAGAQKVTLYLSRYEDECLREKILLKHFAARKTPGVQEVESPYSQKDRIAPDYQQELDLAKPKEAPELLKDIQILEKRGQTALADQKRAQMHEKLKNDLAEWEHQKSLALDTSTKAVVIDLRKQLDGSHIHYVLRVHKDKPLVQLMDTGNGSNFWSKIKRESRESPGRGALVELMQAGIVDGSAQKEVGPGQMLGFCGMGVTPPPPEDLGEMAAFIKKARPIGLFRFVLTRRPSKAAMKPDDVLYVSRLARMYGSSPEQNYTIAQMLWGIRNTPGFTNLQPWVIFFIPRGVLARSMWAHGGREMTLSMFMSEVASNHKEEFGKSEDLILHKHYLPAVVITNNGMQHSDYAGKAQFHCRWKYMSGGSGKAEPGAAWPRPIEAKLKETAWNKIFVHPSFGKGVEERIDALTPSMFLDGAAQHREEDDAHALS